MNGHYRTGAPSGTDVLERFPSLRARVVELERNLSREAPHLVARVTADLKVGPDEGDRSGVSAPKTRVLRSVIDLVEGRSLEIESALSDVLGVGPQELMESSFLDRVHPDDRLRTMREMERVADGKVLLSHRIRHRRADGTYLVFEWAAVADDAGELCYAVARVIGG